MQVCLQYSKYYSQTTVTDEKLDQLLICINAHHLVEVVLEDDYIATDFVGDYICPEQNHFVFVLQDISLLFFVH